MAWLIGVFGLERLRETRVILPTPEFFPETDHDRARKVRLLFDQVRTSMGVDPRPAELSFCTRVTAGTLDGLVRQALRMIAAKDPSGP